MTKDIKQYRVKITGCSKFGIWYENKIEAEYDTVLSIKQMTKNEADLSIVFRVSKLLFIYPEDCVVIEEKII